MRCFLAFKPSEAILARVAGIQETLRAGGADVRWIGPAELHVTLRFLGDLDEARVARLQAAFSTLRQPAFRLSYAGLGEFPKVVWVGASGEAAPLAAAIEEAVEQEGLPRDRHGFTPHLTIGRIRSPRGAAALAAAIASGRDVPLGIDEVRDFSLIQSTLTPQGPVYERVATWELR